MHPPASAHRELVAALDRLNLADVSSALKRMSPADRAEYERIGEQEHEGARLEGRGDSEGAQLAYAAAEQSWRRFTIKYKAPHLITPRTRLRRASSRPRGAGRPARRRRTSTSRDDGEPGEPGADLGADHSAHTRDVGVVA